MLITLAIIGVVAVMTIPTLITQNQEKGWNTSATVFERKLGEALSIMNTQQVLAGYNSTEAFVSELQKHLKIIKTCNSDNLQGCFEDTVYWTNNEEVDLSKLKTTKKLSFSENDFMGDNETNVMGIQLASGVSALIVYNPKCVSNPYSNQAITVTGGVNKNNGSAKVGTNCVAVLYDTTGYKKPNTLSKDLRTINIAGISNSADCKELSGVGCFKPAFVSNSNPIDCTNSNTSTNPDFQYCDGVGDYSNDYWAAAVKACGGASKMASTAQLAQIANYIYGTTACQDKQNCSGLGSWDEARGARAAEFGLPSSAVFWVWSASKYSSHDAWARNFNSTRSNGANGYAAPNRGYQDGWVLCLGD